MVTEHSDVPAFSGSPDGQRPSEAQNWSARGAKAKKKRGATQRDQFEEASSSPTAVPTSDEQLQLMIAEAAYFRAEKRGFAEGYSVDDWLVAEAEIKGTQSS